MAHVNSMDRDKLTSFNTAPPVPPLVCQQVVQPMERVPDYPRMQCVEGLSTPWWMKTTKVETKVGKLLFIFPAISECNIYVGTWRPDTLVAW